MQAVAPSCWRLLLAEDPRRKQLFGSRKSVFCPSCLCSKTFAPFHASCCSALSCWRLARGGSSLKTTFRVPKVYTLHVTAEPVQQSLCAFPGKLLLCPAGASCSQRFRALAAEKTFRAPKVCFHCHASASRSRGIRHEQLVVSYAQAPSSKSSKRKRPFGWRKRSASDCGSWSNFLYG